MSDSKLTTKKRNINNESLFKEVDTFMIELFSIEDIRWGSKEHREQVVMMVEDYMEELADVSEKIVQFDIICDRRNNPGSIERKKEVTFTVKYKQKNCHNISQIDYIFTL